MMRRATATVLSLLPIATAASAPPGEIRLDFLGAGGVAFTDEWPRTLSEAMSAAGDVNGDGRKDFLLIRYDTTDEYEPTLYLVYGRTDFPENVSIAEMAPFATILRRSAPRAGGYDIRGAAPAGDFDGDGLRDLLLGAPNPFDPRGRAHVVFGGPARTVRLYDLRDDGVRISGPGLYQLGFAVEGGGDFNGDGRDDIVVSNVPQPPAASSLFVIFGEAAPGTFLRGDSNQDGQLQLSDAVHLLGFLFLGSEAPPCLDAADTTDDGKLDLTDAVYVLAHLFLGGPPPPGPFPTAGTDPTADTLECGGRR